MKSKNLNQAVKELLIIFFLVLNLLLIQKSWAGMGVIDDGAYWSWQLNQNIRDLRNADTQKEREKVLKDAEYNSFMKFGTELNEEMEDEED